eukprot:1156607-Pelagomonas_calceolata.AAC.7
MPAQVRACMWWVSGQQGQYACCLQHTGGHERAWMDGWARLSFIAEHPCCLPPSPPVVDLAHASAEHDGLDPFPALAVGQALAERAAVARDERLPKLVAIIAGAVGCIN